MRDRARETEDMPQDDVANWASVAEQWIDWVRADGHDAFWAYQSSFENFVRRGDGEAIEIGAGEGRISRLLIRLGHKVTAVEPVAAFLEAARDSQSAHSYVAASATKVPLADQSFDLVVLYNALMDVDDLQGALDEAARLLRPGGRMVIGLVHPLFDIYSAMQRSASPPTYFGQTPIDIETESNGRSMRFRGWQRPLSAYINACAQAGLFVARVCEPEPDPTHPATQRMPDSTIVPMFLWLELRLPDDLKKLDPPL